VFVVDDLMAWLISGLAGAGYQTLITLLLGSEQDRALKPAVKAAVKATAGEISSSAREADRVAGQINKAFRQRPPVALPPGQATLLEALQAGIAGQLSVVNDARRPAVSPPGVQVGELADKLTAHLVREIRDRGAQGGALFPLAVQFGQDLVLLQGQRIEDQGQRIEDRGQRIEAIVTQLLDQRLDAPAPSGSARWPVGRPLAEVGDPFALEVHRPVEPDVPQPGLWALPAYVPREHDAAVAEVVRTAAAGSSGIAVLVGGSSTGKTRACWQALDLLRDLEPGWRLWHPIDPEAALAGLPRAGPRTVVWMNEAQRYLDTPGGTGDRVAARLRELLYDPDRGPVLVLATLWPQFWDQLTTRSPSEDADRRAQARELLTGHDIPVPPAFTDEQLRELEVTADPRLAQAATGSRDGQVTQYLAGAPELLTRYRNAPPAARALIDVAMDARRLGMRGALPRAFLKTAAPGYLTGTDGDLLPGDWLEQALGYTAAPCKGVRGPLTLIRPRLTPGSPVSHALGSPYELADYLDQQGRRARHELIPPASFWAAAASCADPADLGILAAAAYDRGLYRDAALLNKQASEHGDPVAAARLVNLLHSQHPGDRRPARWAVAHARLDNPRGVTQLLDEVGRVGTAQQFATLARRAATHVQLDDRDGVADLLWALRRWGAVRQVARLAGRVTAHVRLDDPHDVANLLHALRGAGATRQVTALLERNPATHARLDDPDDVSFLLGTLLGEGATRQVTALLDRDPAAHVHLDHQLRVGNLLIHLRKAGATGQATTLATRAATQARLDDPRRVAILLNTLVSEGATGQVTALLDRNPAAHARLDDPDDVAWLLNALRRAGATGEITALLDRNPAAHARLDDLYGVANLLEALGEAGATGQVTALLKRNPAAHARLDDPGAVSYLLNALREAATGQVTAMLDRDPAGHVHLDHPNVVINLLNALRWAGATGQATTLASRAATDASLDDPDDVANLLRALGEAGAAGQATTLATRAAAHADLDDPDRVVKLLDALRAAGARTQATALVERLPAAGMFDLFCSQPEVPEVSEVFAGLGFSRGWQFPFGREADGSPAKQWAWTDLG
jgi:hypothetical protein